MAIATAPGREPTEVPARARRLAVRGPSWRDPRLHVAATLLTVQVLGQAALGFEVSIAQILVCLGTCAALEVGVGVVRDRVVAWPASALLTGNGIALVLRVNGTEHGDWWSMRGWGLFAGCAAVSLLSKYAIQVGDRHLFNPSNLGLVAWFVVFGTGRVNPLDLWWAPWGGGLAVAYAVIVAGGLTLLWRLRLIVPVVTFMALLGGGLAVLAASGHAMAARWHVGPVGGSTYWWTIVSSPEVLVFAFFMLTDVRTMPRGAVGRMAYAAVVAVSSVALMATQGTEFGTKVGLLAGLLVGCGVRPLIDRLAPGAGAEADAPAAWLRARVRGGWAAAPVAGAALVAAGLVALSGTASPPADEVAAAVDPAALSGRPERTLPADERPEVRVDLGPGPLADDVGPGQAAALVEDVVVGLAIEAEALAAGDARLAATVVAGDRLAWVHEQLALPADRRAVRRHRFAAATVTTRRDPTDPQAVPRLAVVLDGEDDAGRPARLVVTVSDVESTWMVTEVAEA